MLFFVAQMIEHRRHQQLHTTTCWEVGAELRKAAGDDKVQPCDVVDDRCTEVAKVLLGKLQNRFAEAESSS